MPKEIRELKSRLLKAGFTCRQGGRGGHTTWDHPRLSAPFTLSGKDGSDAQPYQEGLVRRALEEIGETL